MADTEMMPTPEENTPQTPETPEKKTPNWLGMVNDIFDVLELFVFCAAVILGIFTFIIRPTVVQGGSMEDTLLEGDTLMVLSAGYEPTPGDIIVAQNTSLPLYPEAIVKRVIATEGQVIDIDFDTWTLRVDGEVVEEPYRKVTPGFLRTSDWEYPMEIPEGYVFVMGDNRNHSADSRCEDIGLVPEACVVGQVLFRILPLNRITVFD